MCAVQESARPMRRQLLLITWEGRGAQAGAAFSAAT